MANRKRRSARSGRPPLLSPGSTARGRDAMSGDGSGPPLRRAWQVRTAALRAVWPQAIGTRWSGRQAACHQRCLDDRRRPLSRAISVACGTGRSLRSYVCRARECGRIARQMGRSASTISRELRRNGRDAQRGPGLSGNHSAVAMRTGPLGAQSCEAGDQRGAASVMLQDRLAGVVVTPRGLRFPVGGVLERSPTRTSAGSAVASRGARSQMPIAYGSTSAR